MKIAKLTKSRTDPFLDQEPTDNPALCRSTEYSYTPVDGADDGSVRPDSPRKVTEKILGNIVGLTYHVYLPAEARTIRCARTNAQPTDSDNLVSVSKTYTNAAWAGRPLSELRPDGTMTIYSYATNGAGFETNVVATGQPNAGKTAILNGEQTTTVKGSLGEVISVEVHNVVGGQVGHLLSREVYSDFDEFHRARRVTHLDGTFEDTTYACCGVETSTARDGVVTTYLYEPESRRQYGVLRGGVVSASDVDAAGRTTREWRLGTDDSELTLRRMGYDTAGQLTRETNALNGVTGYTNYVDASGHAVRVTTDPAGGQRIETAYRDGSQMSTTGSGAFPVWHTNGAYSGGTWSMEIKGSATGTEWVKTYSDLLGRMWKSEYPGGAISTNGYNAIGQLEKTVDADGVTTLYTYNALGAQEKTILDMNRNGVGTDSVDRVTRTASDVVEANGVVYRRSRSYQTADGGAEVLTGEALSSADGNTTVSLNFGLATTNVTTFNAANLRRTNITTHADGSKSVSIYTNGVLAQIKRLDASGATLGQTDFAYDAHGRQWQVIDLRNGATTFGYNAADLVATNTTPAPGAGQAALVTKTFYDTSLRATNVIHPDNTSAFSAYYANGLLQKTWGSRIYPVEYTYDFAGRMKTLTTWTNFTASEGAAVTTWNYNSSRGWLDSKLYADSMGPSYTYTAGGRLASRTWARGTSTSYGYNNAGDLETVDYSDTTPDLSYTYDRRGRQTSVAQSGGMTINRTLNDVGQLLVESYSAGALDGLAVTNVYDPFLRRTNVATAGVSTGYRYDGASRLSRVLDGANAVGYSFVANSALVGQIAYTNSGAQRMVTTRQFDLVNRLTSISSVPSASSVVSFAYAYNTASQRTGVTNANGAYWAYSYDALGQVTTGKKHWWDGALVAGQQFEYGFDDIGNRTQSKSGGDADGANLRSSDYVANALNQYLERTVPGYVDVLGAALATNSVTVNGETAYRKGEYFRSEFPVDNSTEAVWTNVTVSSGGTNLDGHRYVARTLESFMHDDDGNLTQDGRWNYTWDAENRLVRLVAATAAGPQQRIDFEYDSQSRRIGKKVWNNTAGTGTPALDQRFIYDGWNLLAILDSQSSILQSFTWGTDLSGTMQGAGGVGGLLWLTSHSSPVTRHFACYDGNGNVMALVNAADGTLSAQYEYGPFGEVLRATGPMAKAIPFRFSTKFQDDETDQLYYGYRFYNHSSGRWLSRDPIEEKGGLNLYGFVFNDTVDRLDHLGKNALDLLRKMLGRQVPKAVGISAGGVAIAKLPPLPNIFGGSASGLYFFPDSCELAAFSIRAGLGNTLAEWRLPTAEEWGTWYEGGVLASLGAGFEAASYYGNTTPGSANAASFVGLFHTLQVGFTAEGVPIGASVYFGDKDENGGRWTGGTVGVGPGAGVAVIDWNYQISGGPIILPKCLCYAVILEIP